MNLASVIFAGTLIEKTCHYTKNNSIKDIVWLDIAEWKNRVFPMRINQPTILAVFIQTSKTTDNWQWVDKEYFDFDSLEGNWCNVAVLQRFDDDVYGLTVYQG